MCSPTTIHRLGVVGERMLRLIFSSLFGSTEVKHRDMDRSRGGERERLLNDSDSGTCRQIVQG